MTEERREKRRRRKRMTQAKSTAGDAFKLALQIGGGLIALIGVTVVPAITSYVAMTRATVELDGRLLKAQADIVDLKHNMEALSKTVAEQAAADSHILASFDATVIRVERNESAVRTLAEKMIDITGQRIDLDPAPNPAPLPRRDKK
jgi:hypothetical protein